MFITGAALAVLAAAQSRDAPSVTIFKVVFISHLPSRRKAAPAVHPCSRRANSQSDPIGSPSARQNRRCRSVRQRRRGNVGTDQPTTPLVRAPLTGRRSPPGETLPREKHGPPPPH